MAQSSFLRQLREQLEQGDSAGQRQAKPWQRQGGRHIPQDTLVCEIYDPSLLPTDRPSTTAPSDDLASLQRLRAAILPILAPVLSSHLFHHASFALEPALSPVPHLSATVYFGDCVDDELLLSCALLRLSGQLPALCVHVSDDGGYFVLAEVADALPEWMSDEERLRNRVWLQGGQLRVIDEQLSPQPPASRSQAVQLIADELKRGGQRITVPQRLQAALMQRLADYPAGALQRSRHYIRCLLPLLAVRVLRADESVVSGAVNAFYTRDLIDMRTANKMQTFLPPPPATTTASPAPSSTTASSLTPATFTRVLPYRVRLTRLLYAQLSAQPFTLPRSLLAHPALSSFASLPSSSPLFAALSLSYKLLAGLEMHYHNLLRRRTRHQQSQQQQAEQQAKRKADRQAKRDAWQRRRPMSEQEVEAELRKGDGGEERRRRWTKHVASLKQMGWFTGVRREEEEERWRQRVMMGYAVFDEEEERREVAERRDAAEQSELTADEQRHLAVIERVLQAARTEEADAVAAEVQRWPTFDELEADDSDEWMHSSTEQMARMMAEKEEAMARSYEAMGDVMDEAGKEAGGEDGDEGETDGDKEAAQHQAQSILTAMKGFMGTMSGYEGAEMPSKALAQSTDSSAAASQASLTQQPQQPQPAKKAVAEAAIKGQAGDKAQRQKQLLQVLECDDEKRMMAEVSRYERLYGEGSFDRDLMGSAGELRLDGDDEDDAAGDRTDEKDAQHNAADRKAREAQGGKEVAADSDEDEVDDAGNTGEGGDEAEDEDEDDDVDALLFGDERGSMRDYLASMSKQLSGAGVGREFERAAGGGRHGEQQGEEQQNVDADLNLLKNMLDSLTSQHGMAGPASNLLGAMNVDTEIGNRRNEGRTKAKAADGGGGEQS